NEQLVIHLRTGRCRWGSEKLAGFSESVSLAPKAATAKHELLQRYPGNVDASNRASVTAVAALFVRRDVAEHGV
ncbi:unnamed protein product, partial [Amoebophrya sp. A25]